MSENKLTVRNKIGFKGSSLHARMQEAELLKELTGQNVDPNTLENRLAIILDYSSSMNERIPLTDKTKFELMRDGVQDFCIKADMSSTAIAVQSFPRSGFMVPLTTDNNEIWMKMMTSRPSGDTPMGDGLQATLEHNPTRCMLVSDGDQTDGNMCFEVAGIYREKSIIVDCFHIGNSSRGEETLKRIAEITNGMYFKFKDVGAFAEAMHNFLPGSREYIAMLPADVRTNLLSADESK